MTRIIIALFMIFGAGCAIASFWNPVNLLISAMCFTLAYVARKEEEKEK